VVERTLGAAEAYIGRVRQILMDEAYRRLMALGRKRGVIASTDGDTQVAPTWIAATLHEIACGADAVGGRIVIDRAGRAALDYNTRAHHLREVGYRYLLAELETYLDPDPYDVWPRHYQNYGASLAVTAQMYEQVGGMPPVRTPEDVAFYRALVRVNARFRHSPLVRVTTSARQTGRTNIGLANQLNEWAAMGKRQQPFLVESQAAIETRLRARHSLRVLWWRVLNGYQPSISIPNRDLYRTTAPTIYTVTHSRIEDVSHSNENRYNKDIALLANQLCITTHWLKRELAQPHSFDLLLDRVEQRQQEERIWQQRWPLVKIEQAICDLRVRLDHLRRQHNCLQHQPEPSYWEYNPLQRDLVSVP
jgi:hypothetical protein